MRWENQSKEMKVYEFSVGDKTFNKLVGES